MSLGNNDQFVRDVVIQTVGADAPHVPSEVVTAQPPLEARIDLGAGLWVGQLDQTTVDAVFDACSPPGMNFKPVRWISQRYCFVRELRVPPPPSLKWDEDRRLQDCIYLSRLVNPTTVSMRFSARLFYEGNAISTIVPGPTQGIGSYAWVNSRDWRNWLTAEDAQELRKLLAIYDFKKMPNRLRRAMRHFQYACLTREADVRFTLIVTGFEALVNTSRRKVTNRFKKRLALASRDVGMAVTEDSAEEAYDHRSNLAHGQSLVSLRLRLLNLT
jgi:hypothetical protein